MESNLYQIIRFTSQFFPDNLDIKYDELREDIILARKLEEKGLGLKANYVGSIIRPENPYVIFLNIEINESWMDEKEILKEFKTIKSAIGNEKAIQLRDASIYLALFKKLKPYTDYG